MTVIEAYLGNHKWTHKEVERDSTDAIVYHWVAKAGQRALDVITFFNQRTGSYGGAQFVIDLDGTIYVTVNQEFVAFHAGSSKGYTDLAVRLFGKKGTAKTSSPNWHSIGIEMCHTNWEGEFTEETLRSAAWLGAKLCRDYNLKPHQHVLTHQMVVGWKDCPKWMVDNPQDFEELRWEILNVM